MIGSLGAARLLGVLLTLTGAGSRAVGGHQLSLTIDPCVDIDEEQVRRLVELELTDLRQAGVNLPVITVGCVNGSQEVRVEDPSGRPLVRGMDLRASEPASRDARSRELALAIAELVRRGSAALEPTVSAPAAPLRADSPGSPAPAKTATATTAAVTARPSSPPRAPRWRLEMGALGAFDRFSGGEEQLGADLILNARVHSWVIAQARLGARESPSTTVPDGQLRARALVGALAVGLHVELEDHTIGVALLAGLQGQVVRFSAESDGGAMVNVTNLGALIASGGPAVWISSGGRLSLFAEAHLGGTLHGIAVRSQGVEVASLTGLAFSGALGLVARF